MTPVDSCDAMSAGRGCCRGGVQRGEHFPSSSAAVFNGHHHAVVGCRILPLACATIKEHKRVQVTSSSGVPAPDAAMGSRAVR